MKKKKKIRSLAIAALVIPLILLAYYMYAYDGEEELGGRPGPPSQVAEPQVMYGVETARQAGGQVLMIRAAFAGPNTPKGPPNLITSITDPSRGYPMRLRRVDITLKGGGRRLEMKAEEAFSNEEMTEIKVHGLLVTAQEGYNVLPGTNFLKIIVEDDSIRIEGAQ